MKKLKAITKRVTSNSSSSAKQTTRKPSIRDQSGDQGIKVIRGGYHVDLTHVDETFTEVHKICLLNRNEESLYKLLQTGINPNIVDQVSGSVPLHLSVVANNAAFIRILLSNGAQIDLKDGKGKTALMKSIETENVEIAKFLIYNKANANIPDDLGDTPIFIALRNCFIDCIRVLMLPSANVNFNVLNRNNQLPLHLVTNTNGLNEFLDQILNSTANVDIQDSTKMTPFMLAASCGNKVAIEALIKRHADPGITNINGLMAYDLAKQNGFFEICSIIENASKSNDSSTKVVNNEVKKAVLMNWTDSEDSTNSEDEKSSITINKVNEKINQIDTKEKTVTTHRPSYGSVIDELNKLPQNKSNGNIQPSQVRKSQPEKQISKESASSSSVDLQLRKLESSFLSMDSDDNSPSPRSSTGLLDENVKQNKQEQSSVVNDQFIQRLRDILDDEIRDSNELDELLIGGSSFGNGSIQSVQPFPMTKLDERPNINLNLTDSSESSKSPSPEVPKIEPIQFRPTVPTLAPIRSLVSNRTVEIQNLTSSTKTEESSSHSSNEQKNQLDSPQKESTKSNSVTQSVKKTESISTPKEDQKLNLVEQRKQFNLTEPIKQLNLGSESKELNVESIQVTSGRDSSMSSREHFELNVKLKELQLAYDTERRSRINLETELELLKKNSDSFIHDFHDAFRSKMEFESKLYQAQSENSKLNYELERVKGERDDLVREINVLQEVKQNREIELNSLRIERERFLTENYSLKEQLLQLKDDLIKDSSNLDEENEKKIHQIVIENSTLINEISQAKNQITQLTSDLVKCKSQYETELTIKDNRIKQISTEKEIIEKENQLLKKKFDEIQKSTGNLFTQELNELKNTIKKLNGKVENDDHNQMDSKVEMALDQTRVALEDLNRQIELVKEATCRINSEKNESSFDTRKTFNRQKAKDDDDSGIIIDPIDERLQKLQNSIGLLEERMIQQELRTRNTSDGENEMKFIYPQLVKSLPVGRVPQSAFVRSLLQSQDDTYSKLIREINSVKKDLGLFSWSVEQS